jgi:hypothetical protein
MYGSTYKTSVIFVPFYQETDYTETTVKLLNLESDEKVLCGSRCGYVQTGRNRKLDKDINQ